MNRLETVLRTHGNECEGYYRALADLARVAPIHEDIKESICLAPDLCTLLLKDAGVTRPMPTFAAALTALPLNDAERNKLAATTDVADRVLARSILGDRTAVAPKWFAWLSNLGKADALDKIAREHVRRIPRQSLYDFMQVGRSYVAEIAGLVSGVHGEFTQVYAQPIAAVVDYMDGRADTLADALRAAAGVKFVADRLSCETCKSSLPAALHADIPNRTMFLIAAHESSAYLTATACLILKATPDMTTRDAVRAAADFDFSIQSVLRETAEDICWEGFRLPRGRRIRIHIGAAFGADRQSNRSFGIGANACPGAKLALATAEAFVDSVRPLLPQTTFFDRDRYTSLATRTFRKLTASTGCAA